LAEYALNAAELHATGETASDPYLSLFNQFDALTEDQIGTVGAHDRPAVLTKVFRKYRAVDFRRRVLGAYSSRCAFCGVQLELVDAAHIIPVAASASTDETTNGVALCKLHHAAFDQNLLSFDEQYRIEISDSEVSRLGAANLTGKLREFRRCLRTAIIMPNDRRDYPSPQYIAEARRVRRWS
jgi:putative restriction endonuclease